jgi:hypothetical protein
MLKKILAAVFILFVIIFFLILSRVINDNRTADSVWKILGSSTDYVKKEVKNLEIKDPLVKKYYKASIGKEAEYTHAAQITMTGGFKLGDDWLDLEAEQILFPQKGFVWRASIGSGLSVIKGFDFYYNKKGMVNFKIWGIIPVVKLEGNDIDRASIGRLLAESLLVPSAFFAHYGHLMKSVDKETIFVPVELDGEKTGMKIKISPEGLPVEVVIQRWGDVNPGNKFMYTPFGMKFTGYKTIEGNTIPVEMSGGWNYGTEKYMETVKLKFEKVNFL